MPSGEEALLVASRLPVDLLISDFPLAWNQRCGIIYKDQTPLSRSASNFDHRGKRSQKSGAR